MSTPSPADYDVEIKNRAVNKILMIRGAEIMEDQENEDDDLVGGEISDTYEDSSESDDSSGSDTEELLLPDLNTAVRVFKKPILNINATTYYKMIKFSDVQTQPPSLKDYVMITEGTPGHTTATTT